jgi:hypothetical protein
VALEIAVVQKHPGKECYVFLQVKRVTDAARKTNPCKVFRTEAFKRAAGSSVPLLTRSRRARHITP